MRPNGRPHVRPVDGTWVDNALFVGGSPKAGWVRNLSRDARVAVHLPDIRGVVILEGEAARSSRTRVWPSASQRRHGSNGPTSASSYIGAPVWAIRPDRALGWEKFPADATRWEFERR